MTFLRKAQREIIPIRQLKTTTVIQTIPVRKALRGEILMKPPKTTMAIQMALTREKPKW